MKFLNRYQLSMPNKYLVDSYRLFYLNKGPEVIIRTRNLTWGFLVQKLNRRFHEISY